MAPLPKAMPLLSSPPQMKAALPMATEAAFERATSRVGGAAIDTHPPVQRSATQLRLALQLTLQPSLLEPPLARPAVSDSTSPPLPPLLANSPPSESPPLASSSPAPDPAELRAARPPCSPSESPCRR